ncbi:MAG TPA: hypothetical protein DDZ51_20385 [Planctomycetaceae bacterium]|nr:hypothetical protein [Planctomycetaceae bacterium]
MFLQTRACDVDLQDQFRIELSKAGVITHFCVESEQAIKVCPWCGTQIKTLIESQMLDFDTLASNHVPLVLSPF